MDTVVISIVCLAMAIFLKDDNNLSEKESWEENRPEFSLDEAAWVEGTSDGADVCSTDGADERRGHYAAEVYHENGESCVNG